MKLNGESNLPQLITKRKEMIASTKVLRILMSEIELRGDKNKSKKETDEKKNLFLI